MTTKERTELEKLQKEYNELHERFGYSNSERTCRAINNRLDEICRKMDKLMNGGNNNVD